MKLTVISLFRDSTSYIGPTLDRLDVLNTKYECDFYLYENDSKDNTQELLSAWMVNKEGKLKSETLNAPSFGHVAQKDRMERMAYYRNTALEMAKPLKSEYTLLLDSDVEFDTNIISEYLKHMKDDVVMTTPFIKQNIKCFMCKCGKRSYYDSYALRDSKNALCMTVNCNPFYELEDRTKWDDKKPVKVNSAFGGAALIKTEVLNKVKWSTNGGCEHWNFCKEVRKYGDIIVIPTIVTSTVVDDWTPDPRMIKQQRELLKDPWARFITLAITK
tara:strand:- start:312 stop:1130 length:819 start_codon:yes stop_codon:yes gene_type:complete